MTRQVDARGYIFCRLKHGRATGHIPHNSGLRRVAVGNFGDMSSPGGTTTANGPSSTTEQAKEKAQETAQQAAGQAKNRITEQVDQRSTEAGHRVSSMAQDARSVADELRNQGKDQPAKLAEQAAQRAESLGDYLKNADGDAILRDVEDFGRRQPWVVIAGGIALGFAASRFLKASSSRRYEQQWSAPRATTPPQRLSTPQNGLTTGDPIRTPGTAGTGTGTGTGLPPQPPTPGTGVYTDPRLAGRTDGDA